MKEFFRKRSFSVGFVFGVLFIVLLNIYFSVFSFVTTCFDCYLEIGFPYRIYERWAISRTEQFFGISILANVLVTLIFSFLIGLFSKYVLLRFISKGTESSEINKLFDKAFKVGFWTNVVVFLVLNCLNFVISDYEYQNREIKFSHDGYGWGFPFEMYRNFLGYPRNDIGFTFDGVVLNTFVIVICGFVVGLIFRFAWSKIKQHSLS